MNSKRIIPVLFLSILLIVSPLTTIVLADGEGWLTGWSFRKQHTINGTTGGAQTDYQVGIKVYYGSGVDGTEIVYGVTYGKVYLDSECRTDFGDIRFTNSSGEDELDYWLETKVDSNYVQFWVKVDSIPASPNSVNIYIYYGKADATTTSNGPNTAHDNIFDDFENYIVGNAIPTDGIWDIPIDATCQNDPDAEGHGQTAYLTKAGATGNFQTDVFDKIHPVAIRFWIRRTSNVLRDGYIYVYEDATIVTTAQWNWGDHEYFDGAYRDFNPILASTLQTWEQWEYRIYSNDLHVLNDGIDHDGNDRNAVNVGINKVLLRSGAGGFTGEFYYDDFWIRKFVDPEPEHDKWGPEESAISAPSDPNLLFGAGFNSSTPYVELHWNHSLEDVQFFEVQNSTDGISWVYLGQTTTTNYTDTLVSNGTERYYRVRACNQTDGNWYNSSFTETNFETVYFIPVIEIGPIVIQNVTGEWFYYNLTTINVTVGTHDSGNVNSTLDIDGDTYNCSEVVGAPGYVIEFEWTDIDQDAHCLWVVAYVFYDGNQAHDIHIELYNFTSTTWIEIGTINDAVGFGWVNSSIYDLRMPNDFINSTGAVLGRFYHVAAGNINHDIYIEYLKLQAFIPFEDGAEGVIVTEQDFFWIFIAIVLSIITALLMWLKYEHNNN